MSQVYMNIRNLLITLMFLLNSFSAVAGSAPATSSTIEGVVLGFSDQRENSLYAYFEPDHSKEFIGKFKDACAHKRKVWAIGIPNTFVCTKLEYIEEAGDGPVYELHLSSKEKIKFASHAIIFSLEPLRTYKPGLRQLELLESQSLVSMYKTISLKEAVQNAIDTSSVQILDIPKKSLSIYLIKWKHVEDEYSSNDYYLVINRKGEKFFSAGNFEGDIVGFVDADSDGIPEVQRSIGCDGTCEAITSIYKNTGDFVSIYNH